MIARDETFTGCRIQLDGADFEDCTFKGCELHFAGMFGTRLTNNTFTECSWHFDGAASEAVKFLTALYQAGGRDLVEATIDNIRGQPQGNGPSLN